MLSGAKAFSGWTAASVIAAVLEREPEPLRTTPPLDRIIRKCLAKDPDGRFQNARDLKAALLWAMDTTAVAAPGKVRVPWIIATAAIVALGVSLYLRDGNTTASETRVDIVAPAASPYESQP